MSHGFGETMANIRSGPIDERVVSAFAAQGELMSTYSAVVSSLLLSLLPDLADAKKI